jgi:acetyl-CoA acyltransferase 2
MAASRAVFIVAAKRTPFGTFGGKLKGLTATEMAKVASVAALKAGGVDPKLVQSVIIGNVAQTSTDAPYIARHVGLKSGVPDSSIALTVNRLCGSGFQSIINGAQEIKLGESDVVLTGGTESMSQAPYAVRDARFGSPLGKDLKMEDTLWASLTDSHIKTPMAITGENLAEKYGISRQECDQFALLSQQRWAEANKNGYFNEELVPMEVKGKKGMESFATDEHPRETTLEKLGKLPPVFKENGVVSAGNASGICDGAGAVVLASEEAVNQHNLKPLARVAGYSVSGVDPSIMGIGPAPAIRKLLANASMKLDEIDLVEVNEAFAAQFLSVAKELNLDMSKSNVHGGAIALGHPLGASGSRITAHLVHEMKRRNVKWSIGSACIGGGQGIALLLENMN